MAYIYFRGHKSTVSFKGKGNCWLVRVECWLVGKILIVIAECNNKMCFFSHDCFICVWQRNFLSIRLWSWSTLEECTVEMLSQLRSSVCCWRCCRSSRQRTSLWSSSHNRITSEKANYHLHKANRLNYNYYPLTFWTSEYPSWQNEFRIYKEMVT